MAAKFEMTSDFSKVLADYEKLQRANVRLEQQVAKLVSDTKKAETQTTGWFGSWKNDLVGMAAGYFTLHGAIQLVTSALAEQKRVGQEAARVQMTAADAQAEVVKNMGNVTTEQATEFLKRIDDISAKAGFSSVAPMHMAAASTLSAIGGDRDLTEAILEQTAPLMRNKPEELGEFSGAVGDLVTMVGAKTKREIREAVGLVLTTQQQARIVDIGAFKNVAPALAAVAAVDSSGNTMRAMQQGGALFSAIGGSIKDPEGTLTKTAVATVATKLEDLLPDKDVLGPGGRVKRKGTGLQTLVERLQAVQANPELQRTFFAGIKGEFQKAGFRAPIMPVIEQLLTNPQSEAARRFTRDMEIIKPDEAIFNQVVKNLETATPQLQLASQTRRGEAVKEQMQLGSVGAMKETIKSTMWGTLEQSRQGLLQGTEEQLFGGAKFRAAEARLGTGAAAIEMLRQRRREILAPAERTMSMLAPQFRRPAETLLTEEQRGDVAGIDKAIVVIAEMARNMAEIADNTRKTAEGQAKSGSTAAAANNLNTHREGR